MPGISTPYIETPDAGQPGIVLQMQPGLERSLRCASSGGVAGGCSCPATIPAHVVASAWERQRARGEAPEEGFFRFAWQGELWLAFVQTDGIRGVCCPAHLAAREARTGLVPAA
jgi:hypothetical protein